MNAKNIFKMEMYKNIQDKTYMIVLIVFVTLSLLLNFSWLGVILTQLTFSKSPILLSLLTLATVLSVTALVVFSVLYPFHLLNIDYKNKVMSLMIASGVSRVKYYFVKISSTILSQLLTLFLILFVPFVTFFIFNQEYIFYAFKGINYSLNPSDILLAFLTHILGIIAVMVTMALAVILTRGRSSGLFVFLGFNLGSRMIRNILIGIFYALLSSAGKYDFSISLMGGNILFNLIFNVLEILIFGSIGISYLRKQDL